MSGQISDGRVEQLDLQKNTKILQVIKGIAMDF